jgi:hypothetical protein
MHAITKLTDIIYALRWALFCARLPQPQEHYENIIDGAFAGEWLGKGEQRASTKRMLGV